MSGRFRLDVTSPARRDIDKLPGGVAEAIAELMTASLVESPRRVGKPLVAPFGGQWSARRGEYRVIYRIDDEAHVVTVTRVRHRGQVYRR